MNTILNFLLIGVAIVSLIAAFLAWVITISARAKRAYANINQVYSGTPSSRRQITTPTNVTSGECLLKGAMPCVTLDSYQANIGGMTAFFNGTFALSVTAKSSLSPSVDKAINPGDPIYADGGSTDTPTNVTSGFTLDANTGGVLIGYLDPTGPAVPTGTTATANVCIGPL